MIRLALSAIVGAALAIFLTWDAGILVMVTAAPLGASLVALVLALVLPTAKASDTGNTEEEAHSIKIQLAAAELAALDKWRQSHAQNLTRAEAARLLLVKPLLDSGEQTK